MITVDDLPDAVRGAESETDARKIVEVEVGTPIDEVEKRLIQETLAYTRGDKSRTAQILGIGRKTLYRKLQQYNQEEFRSIIQREGVNHEKSVQLFLASVVLAVTVTAALAQGGPSVVGDWDMVVESPQGKRPSTLVIKQEGNKLSAVVKGARGERPLDSVSLKGDEITMVMTVQFQGRTWLSPTRAKSKKR